MTTIPAMLAKADIITPTSPWCYRIDAVPMPPDRMISYGTRDVVTIPPTEWAAQLAAHCRIQRPEYRDRPLRVMIWRHRGETEYYRAAPPPSPLSVSEFFPAGAPDPDTHICPECEA